MRYSVTKRTVSFPDRLLHALDERAEEEGETFGAVVREACTNHVALTDPKPKKPDEPDLGTLKQKSIGFTPGLWQLIGARSDELEFRSLNHYFYSLVKKDLDLPDPPPKPPRAKRDRDLSAAIIQEAQAEMYQDMRNLRISQEGQPKKKDPEIWERIRAAPGDQMFHVNLCQVPGCHNSDLGLHKHAANQLAAYADAVEAGERT